MDNTQGSPSSTSTKVRSYFRWSSEEEDELRRAVEQFGRKDWELIRVCPDFPLLSGRSSTMLKNKWYKMMRGEKRREDEHPDGESVGNDTISGDTVSTGMTELLAKSKVSPSAPAHLRGKGLVAARKRPNTYQLPGIDGSGSEARCFTNDHEQTVESPASSPLARASQKLSDSLTMLREALAIQVDANKAVASAVAARDAGNGDEEIVRTAMYVASLAQTKAKKARQYVAHARKGHAEVLSSQDWNESPTLNADDAHLMDLIDFMQQQENCEATGSSGQMGSAPQAMPHQVTQLENQSRQQPGNVHPEIVHTVPEVVNDAGANNSEPAMMDLSDNDDEVMAPANDEDLTAFWEPSFMIKLCQDAFLCATGDKSNQ